MEKTQNIGIKSAFTPKKNYCLFDGWLFLIKQSLSLSLSLSQPSSPLLLTESVKPLNPKLETLKSQPLQSLFSLYIFALSLLYSHLKTEASRGGNLAFV